MEEEHCWYMTHQSLHNTADFPSPLRIAKGIDRASTEGWRSSLISSGVPGGGVRAEPLLEPCWIQMLANGRVGRAISMSDAVNVNVIVMTGSWIGAVASHNCVARDLGSVLTVAAWAVEEG